MKIINSRTHISLSSEEERLEQLLYLHFIAGEIGLHELTRILQMNR